MNIHNLKQRGFTLIELLVVIAIIGILASVVLASLNSARDKGATASIQANLNNARAAAELFYDDNTNSYAGVCAANSAADPAGIADHLATANTNNGGTATDAGCNDSATAWAMAAQLVGDDSTDYYCVDSTGYGGTLTGTVDVSAGTADFNNASVSCN